MSKLTKSEQKWVYEVQEVLSRCPSKRLGFYTVGDAEISIYDLKKQALIDKTLESSNADFGPSVSKNDAGLGWLKFPSNVHSTSG